MNDFNNTLPAQNSDDQLYSSNFFRIIKTEYIKNLLLIYFLIISLIGLYVTYQFFMIPYERTATKYLSDQIMFWFLLFLFLLIHFFLLSYSRFSPTLVNFLNEELHALDFEMERKYKKGLSFIIFTSLSIIFFIVINIGLSYSLDYLVFSLNVRILLIYIFSSITIPILRGILHDKFIIKLKTPYYVRFDLQCKLIKHREVESHMIRVYMASNKLRLKSKQSGFELYKEISEKRWLPKRRKFSYQLFQLKSSSIFHEYSTLLNFKEHFLNLVSAIREWDVTN
ncbi:MAG: hypothetical protein ACFFD7_03230 [Candidatus Thorarchaeota archaeon]